MIIDGSYDEDFDAVHNFAAIQLQKFKMSDDLAHKNSSIQPVLHESAI